MDEISQEERAKLKLAVDEQISQVYRGSMQARKIIALLIDFNGALKGEKVYTPLDFVIELNQKLKNDWGKSSNGIYTRKATIDLDIEGISEECRRVDVQVQISVADILASVAPEPAASATDVAKMASLLDYYVKGCTTENEFVKVFSANIQNGKIHSEFANQKFNQILQMGLSTKLRDAKCDYQMDTAENLVRLSCENLSSQISQKRTVDFDEFRFDKDGNPQVRIEFSIFDGDVKAGSFLFEKFSDGPPRMTDLLPAGSEFTGG